MSFYGRKYLLLASIVVCGVAALVVTYLITKPQRDAENLIRVLEQVQVGRTRIEDIAPALRRIGALAPSENERCENALDDPRRTKASRPEGLEQTCSYHLEVKNEFLHRLRLAPITGVVVNIQTSNGTVDQLLFFVAIEELGNIGLVKFIQVADKPTDCGRDTCVKRFHDTDGRLVRIESQASASASPTERNRLLDFNTHCFSKIGGCKNAGELLSITETN